MSGPVLNGWTTALSTLGVLPTMRSTGTLPETLGQIEGRMGGLPQGGGAAPFGRKTSSTSFQLSQMVDASLPIVPPLAGEFSAMKVSQELKSNACCRLGRSNGGTASRAQGRPLVSSAGVMDA